MVRATVAWRFTGFVPPALCRQWGRLPQDVQGERLSHVGAQSVDRIQKGPVHGTISSGVLQIS